jgi:hypothetical protein
MHEYDKEAAMREAGVVIQALRNKARQAGGAVVGAAKTTGAAVERGARAVGEAGKTVAQAGKQKAQQAGGAVSSAAKATGAKAQEVGGKGLDWVKANPKKSLGIGAAGVGTLGFAAGRGSKNEKEGSEKIATILVGEWLRRRYGE